MKKYWFCGFSSIRIDSWKGTLCLTASSDTKNDLDFA